MIPWRLIIFVAIFAVFLVFISFNLENKCDISFGFAALKEVPVFITIFSSFVLGLFCAIPLVVHIKKKREGQPLADRKKKKNDGEENIDGAGDAS